MIKLFLPLFFLFSLLFAEQPSVPHANIEGLPSSFVNASVNVITGDYCEEEIDFVVAGPEPLFHKRYYCSAMTSTRGLRWNTSVSPCLLILEDLIQGMGGYLHETSGISYFYYFKRPLDGGTAFQPRNGFIYFHETIR